MKKILSLSLILCSAMLTACTSSPSLSDVELIQEKINNKENVVVVHTSGEDRKTMVEKDGDLETVYYTHVLTQTFYGNYYKTVLEIESKLSTAGNYDITKKKITSIYDFDNNVKYFSNFSDDFYFVEDFYSETFESTYSKATSLSFLEEFTYGGFTTSIKNESLDGYTEYHNLTKTSKVDLRYSFKTIYNSDYNDFYIFSKSSYSTSEFKFIDSVIVLPSGNQLL